MDWFLVTFDRDPKMWIQFDFYSVFLSARNTFSEISERFWRSPSLERPYRPCWSARLCTRRWNCCPAIWTSPFWTRCSSARWYRRRYEASRNAKCRTKLNFMSLFLIFLTGPSDNIGHLQRLESRCEFVCFGVWRERLEWRRRDCAQQVNDTVLIIETRYFVSTIRLKND